jgi:predicted kinase
MKLVLMLKAQRRGDLIPVKKQITRGGKSFMQTVWVSPKDAAKMGGGAKAEEPAANGHKFGMHNIDTGDTVSFEWEGTQFTGQAVGKGGKNGLLVLSQGIKHKVPWDRVKKVDKPKAEKPKTDAPNNTPGKKWIESDKFNAAEWKKQWDDPKATPDEKGFDYILDSFGTAGAEIAEKIKETEEILKGRPQTWQKYRISGEGESARYTEDREKLHGRIMQDLLSPDKLRSALPPVGEKPTFMILGGRGGSGKSWFKNNVYDPAKFIILDADEIKAMLPEFDGWNAQDVHEESSDILEQMLTTCVRNGLNVVFDGTMKTASSALAKVFRMKAAGYRTEAHYMHLPRQEAAKRAIGRFKNGGKEGPNGEPPEPFAGRYVPVDIILKNTTNEDSFDQLKGLVDKWSFRDNNVEKRGDLPIIISEGAKAAK